MLSVLILEVVFLTITIAILIPFLAAFLVPFIYKRVPSRNIGWFVLFVPLALFIVTCPFYPFGCRWGNLYTYD